MKKIKTDGSKTIYPSTGLRAGSGGIYEVDKTSGGSTTRTVTYYPVAGAMRIDSTLYYILKDHLGSASVVTDASGNVLGEQRYYPFGETRLTTGTIYTDRLFTGQREMAGLGIYHYGARFYSPKLGRFISADSIVPGMANPQNLNRFSYVRNNPLRYIDPTGHMDSVGGDGGCFICTHPPQPTTTPTSTPKPQVGPIPTPPTVITTPIVTTTEISISPTATPIPSGTTTNSPKLVCSTPIPGTQNCSPATPTVGFKIGFKPWEDIDKIDLVVDVLGVVGDVALAFGGPPGAVVWVGSELLEFIRVGKPFDQLDTGDPSGVVSNTIVTVAQSASLIPAGGWIGNLVSIGLNVLTIEPVP